MNGNLMPSGGKTFQFGDKCKGCDCVITGINAAYKGTRLIPWCNSYWKSQRESFPSRTKHARHENWLSWKFGLTKDQYDIKLMQQFCGCAICKQPCETRTNLAVDHDHKTNAVRDLLCHRCNTVLGMVHDDEDLLIDMIEYLKRHAQKTA